KPSAVRNSIGKGFAGDSESSIVGASLGDLPGRITSPGLSTFPPKAFRREPIAASYFAVSVFANESRRTKNVRSSVHKSEKVASHPGAPGLQGGHFGASAMSYSFLSSTS